MGLWGGARDPEGTALTPVEEEGSGTQFPVTWVGGIPFSISVVTCRVDHHSHARPQGRTSRGWPEVLALYPLGFLLILKMTNSLLVNWQVPFPRRGCSDNALPVFLESSPPAE